MEETIINKRVNDFSKHSDLIQTVLIYLIALLVPAFLAQILKTTFGASAWITTHSQIIVGSIVNVALIITAINLKGWIKILGVVTMPSISTILSGYVFGTASVYMMYMIPAIWIGNFALIYSFKLFMLDRNKNYFLAGVIGIVVKVAAIFGCFSVLRAFSIFPDKIVLTLQGAMSITQLITATIGMIISFGIFKLETK